MLILRLRKLVVMEATEADSEVEEAVVVSEVAEEEEVAVEVADQVMRVLLLERDI